MRSVNTSEEPRLYRSAQTRFLRKEKKMAKKKVTAVIKLQCPAQKATPAPPVGPALGPHESVHLSLSSSSMTRPKVLKLDLSSQSSSLSTQIRALLLF